MRPSGRLSAAIDILDDFSARRVPLKTAIADWARSARYAGAKDRAWISGLCLDVLRRRLSLGAAMKSETSRAAALAALRFLWGMGLTEIEEMAREEPHGPGALSEEEVRLLGKQVMETAGPNNVRGDYPAWLEPHIIARFGDGAVDAMSAMAERADVDLRINHLKTNDDRAIQALKAVKAVPAGMLSNAVRIPAPPAQEKAAAITVIPAYNKGWVEVQDLGSQIAAAAAGDVRGKQVLDYCAGGGGKTLALAALMKNTGQLFAFDVDARRLKPIYARAKRAGARNLQVINPVSDKGALATLTEKMDIVFVDAPCTGSGTWRRHPDTKWRLTEKQLNKRCEEQRFVLDRAADFVKPGCKLVYVICSIFVEENEIQIDRFLKVFDDFVSIPILASIEQSGLLTQDAMQTLSLCQTSDEYLQLTPDKVRADGFFVAVLQRQA